MTAAKPQATGKPQTTYQGWDVTLVVTQHVMANSQDEADELARKALRKLANVVRIAGAKRTE